MAKNTVLITGAAGFIARYVAKEFSGKGWQVVGLGRGEFQDWRNYGLSAWYGTEVTLDALLEFARKPDAIVHCAGGSSVGFSVEQPAADFGSTVRTTSSVLEYVRVHSPFSRFVYLSSAAVYGRVETLPINEDAPLRPISPYGVHKMMAEHLCRLYARQYGLLGTIVRLFSIYGPGLRKQLLWDACCKLERGETAFYGTGNEVRDWLHVEDASRLIFAAAQHATRECSVVNAGFGRGVRVKEVLEHLGKTLDAETAPIFSSEAKTGDPEAYVADIAKARAWNWMPQKHWREGVSEYVEWYKQCQ